ncbi:MAG: amidase [Alphaproteobacteria bacterium]|nr:MAG: amidase [Alphaproteobacteria bacterium]
MTMFELSATEAIEKMRGGAITCAELVDACLERIEEREEAVQAWTFLDADVVRAQAKALDENRAAGRPIGPLHGLPVGIKDIIDTKGMPTENGTVLDAGRVPNTDAVLVSQLRSAGAVIMGKTVATELAYFAPGKTHNPHDPARTPGGSSSGSAAAVAAGMVPLAVGTQTAGSVIRPAAFCGIVGFKPSRGLISRRGVLCQAHTLDTIGVFARSVPDAAMIAEALAAFDPQNGQTPRPTPPLLATAESEAPVPPSFAFVKQPAWDRADADTSDGFAEIVELLGEQCDEFPLPAPFDQALEIHHLIQVAELAKHFSGYVRKGRDQLSEKMLGAIDEGAGILASDYLAALDWIGVYNAGLDEIFDRYDAIITPAAPGEAPADLTTTGDPAFCSMWTLIGVPAVTLPLLQSANNMPLGVQLIGRAGDDARLLRTARWLALKLSQAT